MPDEKQVQEFKQRIAANLAKARAGQYAIQPVDPADQGVMDTCFSQAQFVNIYEAILHPNNEAALQSLKPGQSIPVPRPKGSNAIRSFNICMNDDGEIFLMIEPKSKRRDNTKRDVDWVGGGFKTRKIAVRADTPVAEVNVAMIEYLEITADEKRNARKMQRIEGEIKQTNEFCGLPGFPAYCLFGGIKSKRKNGKSYARFVTYAPYMPSDLYSFLKGNWAPSGVEFKPEEMLALKYDIMQQIIRIIETMHDKKTTHKDLKPENFLIKYNYETARFEVIVIDFGMAKKFGERDGASGTGAYMPPWILRNEAAGFSRNELMGHKNPNRNYTAVEKETLSWFTSGLKHSLGWHVLKSELASAPDDPIPKPASEAKTSGEHDVWSLGVMMYEMIYALDDKVTEMPEKIKQNAILQHIFGIDEHPDKNFTQDDLPTIEGVRERFEDSSEIQSILLHLPKPEEHKYDPAKTKTTQGLDDAFRDQLSKMDDYVEKIRNLKADSLRRTDMLVFMEVCPIFADAQKLTFKEFKKIYPDKFERSGYKALNKFSDYMCKPRSARQLKAYAAELQSVLNDLEVELSNHARLNDEEWLISARWKLFLHTALALTNMRLDAMQNQIVVRPHTSWLVSANKFYSMLKASKPDKPVNYVKEVSSNLDRVATLFDDIKAELHSRNFTREFGKSKV